MGSYDVIGHICILNFYGKNLKLAEKKKIAEKLIRHNKPIRTVVEKSDKIKGRLRTFGIRHLAGEKTLETTHKENKCIFRLNLGKCYFSPRLSEERKQIAHLCRKGERILVMFSGIAPFSIVIAKNKPSVNKVISIELGKECNKYARENVKMNKLEHKVEIIQGDVKKVIPELKIENKKLRFDRIIMPRPNLRQTFLRGALMVAKKGTIIHYYGFCNEGEKDNMVKKLLDEAEKLRRKLKFLKIKKAGDIGPYKFRWRIDLKVVR